MMKQNIVSNLGIPGDKIEMKLTRMGGGFGGKESQAAPFAAMVIAIGLNIFPSTPSRVKMGR